MEKDAKNCLDCGKPWNAGIEQNGSRVCTECLLKCRRIDCLKPWDRVKTGRNFCDECVERDLERAAKRKAKIFVQARHQGSIFKY